METEKIKIAQLTNQTSLSDTDLVIIETATSTNKMTVGKLKELLFTKPDYVNAILQNNWVKSATGSTPSYSKDLVGVVRLKGTVTGGNPVTAVFNLPAGFRPPETLRFTSLGKDASYEIRIFPDGNVVSIGTGVSTDIFLDGISFVSV